MATRSGTGIVEGAPAMVAAGHGASGDLMHLQSSDFPGMKLLSTQFNGDNFLTWSRVMKIALGAKEKLGFVTGKMAKPNEDDENFEQWIRTDYMVRAWILNAIIPEIGDAFLYTSTAKELWDELHERYGDCNGPLLYQIQREISSMTQGNMSIAQYFTRLKKLWDELQYLHPLPVCNCGAAKEVEDYNCSIKLIQFLMGLSESYDNIRNQILVLDPLPSVNKAYSLILRVEKQRQVHVHYPDVTDSAMLTQKKSYTQHAKKNFNTSTGSSSQVRKVDKSALKCSECGRRGHTIATCFQIYGEPDWFKEYKAKQAAQNGTRHMAHMADLSSPSTQAGTSTGFTVDLSTQIQGYIQSELQKALKGGQMVETVHMASMADFEGP